MKTHTFHIPVMGTGFTIDTPLKVARYGISSVLSLGDDKLIEKIRRYYCNQYGEPFTAIPENDRDRRAKRITAYLDLVQRTVSRQMDEIRRLPFEAGNDLTLYFTLLGDGSDLKSAYLKMLDTSDQEGRRQQQDWLRKQVLPGSIDVNIMTKADRENTLNGEKLPREFADAMAALRGFALSTLNASVVFSAGLNPYLYSYAAEFEDFRIRHQGRLKKQVILKVSDYRSASVQSKMLAKKGIWVSEFRIESGLNCGGHAFPTAGHLLGPILEEFKKNRQDLIRSLFLVYCAALTEKGYPVPETPDAVHVTAQGGVGTAAEHRFLLRYYELDSVGWGSPFLLVPEATAVDEDTLQKLAAADENDIFLSHASPLGVPFYNLHSSASEIKRRERIERGKPGSPCLSKYLAFNTEFGEPLCVSSARYQNLKLNELRHRGLDEETLRKESEHVLEKACICRNLGDGVLMKYGIPDEKKVLTPAICPGPNLKYFSRIFSLKEMLDHIYGRDDILDHTIPRSHMLVNELKLYVDHLKGIVAEALEQVTKKEAEHFKEFKRNLMAGIGYYLALAKDLKEETEIAKEKFVADLRVMETQLESLVLPEPVLSS